MLRGYILVELDNGKTYKYTRDVVKNGDPKNYYRYGDTRADTYLYQGDTPGKIKYDFDHMVSIFKSRSGFGGKIPTTMLWPESAGDTETLIRVNLSNATMTKGENSIGDTFFTKLKPMTRLVLDSRRIISITSIEERSTQWYIGANNSTGML
jgi:hypothetical protein